MLKKPEHFAAFIGSQIELKLYRALEGRKEWMGELLSYQDGDVTIQGPTGDMTFMKKDIAQVRLHVTF